MNPSRPLTTLAAAVLYGASALASQSDEARAEDARAVAALDTRYQDAVKRNDADGMARILADDFVLVVGTGTTYTKADLLKEARERSIVYERQDEEPGTQKVRVWGDTAVITAKLWIKGKSASGELDRKLWFSDTYVRTKDGWKYVFGQASIALPKEK
jgi:ketosteroid isomerase-like protein